MRKTVVVLLPDMRGQQVIERRDRFSPWNLPADFQPFRMLVEHRIDDMDERLVARKQAVSTGQQIAFKPALAQVFAQHFHHPSVRRQVHINGRDVGHPRLAGDIDNRAEPIGGSLIRAEQAKVATWQISAHHVGEE